MSDENRNEKKPSLETRILKLKPSFGTKTRFIWHSDKTESTAPKIIELQKVTLTNENESVFSLLDFDVRKNEKIAVIGESGTGKTQLLFLCAGLTVPDEGLILVNGIDPSRGKYEDIVRVRRRIGLVFQEGVIINNITIYDNIALPLRYHSVFDEKDVEKKVKNTINKFKLNGYENKKPAETSLGILRLTAYARAYIIEPLIYLIDEPFTDLDTKGVNLISDFLDEIKHDRATTLVMTGSNASQIDDWVDRIVYIENKSIVSK
ncbi:MAG: ATP-binding cassette domain-containing protein [Planctomycetes bacterium]|nr:ATP-binding cassette domain-containing protein [Planctomycetota bacterium]